MAGLYSCLGGYEAPGSGGKDGWVLIGASGPSLVIQSSSGASTVWSANAGTLTEDGQYEDGEGPPAKRPKISLPTEKNSNFSCLAISNNKNYLVAVTAEDKCIRVFQIDTDFKLEQLSQRCMARRPCAISITSDDRSILCADKFGDVYALPLIAPPEDEQNGTPTTEETESTSSKQFIPSATVLTVHSGRNRRVLEEQMKQAAKGSAKSKEPMKFKHDLLLGHVSMLTDIAYTQLDGRSYIITADRDEHIRVSRGPPQAHIIEGFCHGHEAFVSRLCLATPTLLVSGGGDNNLFVWDWPNYRLLEKIPIRDHVLRFLKEHEELSASLAEDEANFNVAVSGIWPIPSGQSQANEVLVACEAIPALFSFKLEATEPPQVLALRGNALDVALFRPRQGPCTAAVSVDNVHLPGSTTEIRKDEVSDLAEAAVASPKLMPTSKGASRLQCFSYRQNGQWSEDAAFEEDVEWLSRRALRSEAGGAAVAAAASAADEEAIRDILYRVGHLRKQPGSVE